MKNMTLLSLFLFSCLFLNAQTPSIHCGQELLLKHWENNYPELRRSVDEKFDQAQAHIRQASTRSTDVYKIPVVVHIVWKDSIENLPDSIIQAQMKVLNDDFRRKNADADNIRSIFSNIVGDPMIEFELVEVIRLKTNSTFEVQLTGSLPDNVKQSSLGGSDARDTEKHLNIWVCEIQPISFGGMVVGEILGYAYPPAGLSNWPDNPPVNAPSPELDGVVIDFRAFGPNNPYPITIPGLPFDLTIKGRTAVHEIGHYLGLRHIWGDGGGLYGGDSCGEDDGISDTPNSGSQSNFDCDTLRNTCTDANNDLPDMIENYMDYASEACMNSFTQGQIDHIRSVLENERCGLIDNCAMVNTSTVFSDNDLQIYPNPVKDQLTIQLKTENLSSFRLNVYDLLGRKVVQEKQAGSQLSVEHLSPGIYLLTLQKGKQQYSRRIVVE